MFSNGSTDESAKRTKRWRSSWNKNVNWLRLKNTHTERERDRLIRTMEPVILISCLMVYTIVIFIVQCQKHHSYRFISLCSFFVSILFVFLRLFLYFWFSLVEICCYLPSALLQSMYLVEYLCVFYSSSLLMSTCAYQFRCVKGIYCTVLSVCPCVCSAHHTLTHIRWSTRWWVCGWNV